VSVSRVTVAVLMEQLCGMQNQDLRRGDET
jgi:hypothetical protein